MKKIKFLLLPFVFTFISSMVFAQTKSYPFDVKISGKGKQSIIFIPGFASSGEVWNETKLTYEKDFTCYTLTMAGFAEVKPQPNATFTNWETSIVNYIKENKIEKPIIIGHSMGGGLALAIASDYPDLIKKIVVVDALPCLQALSNPAFKAIENPDCSQLVNQMTALTQEQFYQIQTNSISRLVAETSKQELVIGWSVNSDRKTFAEMYCDFTNTDLRQKIENIKCPSLILLEDSFKTIKPAIEEQYKNLKNANLEYSTKGLHFIMYDDKEWYLNQLNNFLN
ncbi:alpha/beta hydrolase [Polaribacter filamentus]|jgi:pimeloyl-ACP methyl ester carboxylesterase|uniref:Alpha/beta hydrolase n=1 Tax=Polaribacter filamentus TaxID=53483 RepID=A0A2S7KWA7_9FLAO|nr:alpha/beta hydrolase [Polaribacter filamentus]PQB06934.1 alpha/beta hydrolase [Polaribacter filamentus]